VPVAQLQGTRPDQQVAVAAGGLPFLRELEDRHPAVQKHERSVIFELSVRGPLHADHLRRKNREARMSGDDHGPRVGHGIASISSIRRRAGRAKQRCRRQNNQQPSSEDRAANTATFLRHLFTCPYPPNPPGLSISQNSPSGLKNSGGAPPLVCEAVVRPFQSSRLSFCCSSDFHGSLLAFFLLSHITFVPARAAPARNSGGLCAHIFRSQSSP